MERGQNGRKLWRCKQCGKHVNIKQGRYSRKFCTEKCFNIFYSKKCSICGEMYPSAFKHQKTCNKCVPHKKPWYKEEPLIKRDMICSKCGIKIGINFVVQKYNTNKIDKSGLCKKCKEKNKRLIEESWKESSIRMTKNNPMFNPIIRKKVSLTFRKKIKNGEIKYKNGKDHHLYKGNRGFYSDCRSQLYYKWVRKVLKRDKFICTICETKKNLQVHHIRPFRIITNIIFKKNNIKNIKNINSNTYFYWDLIKQIIEEHHLNDGITVCCKCHGDIDEKYRRYKGRGEKNLPGKI